MRRLDGWYVDQMIVTVDIEDLSRDMEPRQIDWNTSPSSTFPNVTERKQICRIYWTDLAI